MADLHDAADWTDIQIRSTNVGAVSNKLKSRRSKAHLQYRGYTYCTEGELQLAQLLHKLGVPFTPDVSFRLDVAKQKGKKYRQFVPDFVFNKKAWLWVARKKRPELIHGLEAKRACKGGFPESGLAKVRLLYRQRKIRIKLISNQEIAEYFRTGYLPLKPF